MSPFETYQCYIAMKAHFTSDSYDIFRSKGRIKCSFASFETRKDRYRLEKLSKRFSKDSEIVDYFLSNFVSKPNYTGMWDDQSDQRYIQWLKRNQSLSYNFRSEIKKSFMEAKLDGLNYTDMFSCSGIGQHPHIFVGYLRKDICIETFIILNRINNFTGNMNSDIAVNDILRTARKYSPFLKVDIDVYTAITEDVRKDVWS